MTLERDGAAFTERPRSEVGRALGYLALRRPKPKAM